MGEILSVYRAQPRPSTVGAARSQYPTIFFGMIAVYMTLLVGLHGFLLDLYLNDFLERKWLAGIESPNKGAISTVYVIVIAHLCALTRPKLADLMMVMLAIFPVLPMIALYSYRGSAPNYVAMVVLIYIAMWAFTRIRSPAIVLSKVEFLSHQTFVALTISLTIVFVLAAIYSGNLATLNFSFSDVYEYREKSILTRNAALEYLLSNLIAIFIPVSMAILLKSRRYPLLVALILLTFLLFGLSSHKSHAFVPLFVLAFFVALGWRRGVLVILAGICFTILFSTLLFRLDESLSWLGTITTRRMFFVPAYANYLYYDYFSLSPHMWWADSRLSLGLVHNPYGMSVPQVIMYAYGDLSAELKMSTFEGFATANTGFLGAGYAQGGFFGMAFYALIVSILLRIGNILARKIGYRAASAGLAHFFITVVFSSTDTLTIFLSYGGLAIPLLAFALKTEPHAAPRQSGQALATARPRPERHPAIRPNRLRRT